MSAAVLNLHGASSPARRRRSPAVRRQALLMPMLYEPPANERELPVLRHAELPGPLLRPNPLSNIVHGEVLGLNLTSSCASRCVFCYARANPSLPGTLGLTFDGKLAERMRHELRQRRQLPRAVYLSPSTDPFPPYADVQEVACQVVETLAEAGVDAWIMTRGLIRPFARERLACQRQRVRVTLPMTTLDRQMQRMLEPLTASPRLRLKQLKALRDLGIRTEVALEPLLPGLTDTRANLEPLLDALADLQVKRLTVGFAYLRHGIQENLEKELPEAVSGPLIAEYASGPLLTMPAAPPAQHLPRRERQRVYGLLMTLAARRGISVSVSALLNPDFSSTMSGTSP
jgi:DNA repair photolyase